MCACIACMFVCIAHLGCDIPEIKKIPSLASPLLLLISMSKYWKV